MPSKAMGLMNGDEFSGMREFCVTHFKPYLYSRYILWTTIVLLIITGIYFLWNKPPKEIVDSSRSRIL